MRVREIVASAAMRLAQRLVRAEGSPSDESIRSALLATLRTQGLWDPYRCDVLVRDGIVRIAGVVSSAQEKIATRTAAERIPGVRAVRDGRSYWVPIGGFN